VRESNLKTFLQVLVFTIIGAAILYFMWQSQGSAYTEDCALRDIPADDCSLLDKLVSDYANANIFWLIVISTCFTISQVFRSVRWKLLLRPMGYEISHFNSFATLMVGYFANLGIPRIGEFVRAGMISKYEDVAIEKAFATIVIERIVDVIMLLIMIILGLVFHYDALWGYVKEHINVSTSSLLTIIGILVVGSVLGLYLLKKILSLDNDKLHPIARKIKDLIEGFVEGIMEIRNLPQMGMFIFYSIGIWVMYYLMHYLAFFAFEPTSHLSAIDGILVFDFGTLGVVFPSPGGMGSYHFMIKEALLIFGINTVDGFSFAMITFFTLTIFCTIFIGLISLILLPIINQKKVR